MIYNVIQPATAKFEWGDETAIGDAEWWAGLKAWITGGASASDRAACVGKKKLVSLSTAVLGANAATMVCIGADQDGDKTLAFQTLDALPNYAAPFGKNAVWVDSSARSKCQDFYNYCSAKESIKTVSKGTCKVGATWGATRNQAATYNDETVWLPSEREMGLDSYSCLTTEYSTTTNAECTYGYNAAYTYYANDSDRKKWHTPTSGSTTYNASYYTRSLSITSYNYEYNDICRVNGHGKAEQTSYNYYGGTLAPAFVIG